MRLAALGTASPRRRVLVAVGVVVSLIGLVLVRIGRDRAQLRDCSLRLPLRGIRPRWRGDRAHLTEHQSSRATHDTYGHLLSAGHLSSPILRLDRLTGDELRIVHHRNGRRRPNWSGIAAGQGGGVAGAAYRNRTDDLRITRASPHRRNSGVSGRFVLETGILGRLVICCSESSGTTWGRAARRPRRSSSVASSECR